MDDQGAKPSLIMQRMAIERVRIFGIGLLGLSIVGTVFGVVQLIAGGGWIFVLQLVIGAVLIGFASWQLRTARQRLSEFEARNGRDAGKQ
ncbi:hypothetical protein [Agromyces salentinus]|uniref:DUF4229 domain-containing protein n=1 Tax=Agromyces salentinus TaxID=269421 RepID=A0ABN2N0X0_9MICO|nr:hypothetical protein [Agromyces salentinus]